MRQPGLARGRPGPARSLAGLRRRPVFLYTNRLLVLLAGAKDAAARIDPGAAPPPGYNATSWAFVLSEPAPGKTRLVSRFRIRAASAGFAADLAFGLIGTLGGAVLQQPAMFHGLKLRAEGRLK